MAFKHCLALLPALLWQAAALAAPDAGQRLAASCANCHGTSGVSRDGKIPSLAGMPQATLAETVQQYQSGARAGSIMPQLAKGYTAAQIELIAAYFAAQKK
jgi:cytochrome subunit of sulfide dehydrogenase